MLVDNVFRKGGVWRVEGTLESGGVAEIDLDATFNPPKRGDTIQVSPRRSHNFPEDGAKS